MDEYAFSAHPPLLLYPKVTAHGHLIRTLQYIGLRIPYPNMGPPCDRSNTWRGLRSHRNICISLAPWFPPLLGLMNTSRGLWWRWATGFTWCGGGGTTRDTTQELARLLTDNELVYTCTTCSRDALVLL